MISLVESNKNINKQNRNGLIVTEQTDSCQSGEGLRIWVNIMKGLCKKQKQQNTLIVGGSRSKGGVNDDGWRLDLGQ